LKGENKATLFSKYSFSAIKIRDSLYLPSDQ